MAIGLLLYIYYDRPDLMGAAFPGPRPGEAKDVFLTFIMTGMPHGLAGLMMAGMFAAALSSLSSALNAMSATFVNDVYRRLAPGRDERHYVAAGRVSMLGWAALLGGFACVCVFWYESNAASGGQTLIDFALGVMNFAYAGLAAVFCTAIFTRRGNGASAIASLAIGFLLVLLMQPNVWAVWTRPFAASSYTPGSTSVLRILPEHPPAFPWVLLIAFIAALVTCCLGARTQQPPLVRAPLMP
jgi:Na+/proline symporter